MMEYYLALKKDVLIHAAVWLNLEDTMLREIGSHNKTNII